MGARRGATARCGRPAGPPSRPVTGGRSAAPRGPSVRPTRVPTRVPTQGRRMPAVRPPRARRVLGGEALPCGSAGKTDPRGSGPDGVVRAVPFGRCSGGARTVRFRWSGFRRSGSARRTAAGDDSSANRHATPPLVELSASEPEFRCLLAVYTGRSRVTEPTGFDGLERAARVGLRRFFSVRPTRPLRSAFRRRRDRIWSAVFGAVCGRSFPSGVRPAPWCSPARQVEGFSSDRFPVRGGGL